LEEREGEDGRVFPPPPISSPSQREGEDLEGTPPISSPSQREGED